MEYMEFIGIFHETCEFYQWNIVDLGDCLNIEV